MANGEDLDRAGLVVHRKRVETSRLGAAEGQQDKGMADKREKCKRIWDDSVMVTLDG